MKRSWVRKHSLGMADQGWRKDGEAPCTRPGRVLPMLRCTLTPASVPIDASLSTLVPCKVFGSTRLLHSTQIKQPTTNFDMT